MAQVSRNFFLNLSEFIFIALFFFEMNFPKVDYHLLFIHHDHSNSLLILIIRGPQFNPFKNILTL